MNATASQQIERAARLYKSNQDASQALGLSVRYFARLCKKHGIETPYERRVKDRKNRTNH